MKARKKIELSKETLRDLTARPLTHAEVTLIAGGTAANCGEPINTLNCPPSMQPPCGGTSVGHSCACYGSQAECAGSTGCNSTTDACPIN